MCVKIKFHTYDDLKNRNKCHNLYYIMKCFTKQFNKIHRAKITYPHTRLRDDGLDLPNSL